MESPMIIKCEWGDMDVIGVGTGKDFKLWPGGGREWDWKETGTQHVPGIQAADIQELIDNGAEILVLSRGKHNKLRISKSVLAWINQTNIPTIIADTDKSVEFYNNLASKWHKVGGLFHSTC